jgi:hypothetical protein
MQECWEGMTINILDLIELVFWCILIALNLHQDLKKNQMCKKE